MRNYLQELKTQIKKMVTESPEKMTMISVLLILATLMVVYGKEPTPQQVLEGDFLMRPANACLALLADLRPDIYCKKHK